MANKKVSRSAIAALAFGAFFWVPLLNFFLGAAALYFGFSALKEIKKQPKMYKGKVYAALGMLLGALPLYLGILVLVRETLKFGELLFAQIVLVSYPTLTIALLVGLKLRKLL